MRTVPQNRNKFTINDLFYYCKALIFTHPLVYEFLCGPKHMATPVFHTICLLDSLEYLHTVKFCKSGFKIIHYTIDFKQATFTVLCKKSTL